MLVAAGSDGAEDVAGVKKTLVEWGWYCCVGGGVSWPVPAGVYVALTVRWYCPALVTGARNLNRRRARPGSFGGVAECTGSSKAGSFQGCDLQSCGPLVPLWEKDRALAGKYCHSTHVSASHLITQVAVAQGQGP